jgi:uncharacterized membrane protein YphA (DoxX/SURF4 family)
MGRLAGTIRSIAKGDAAARASLAGRVAAVAQAVTIRWTWLVWQPRRTPPNLPAIAGLARVHWAPVLVGACVVAVLVPRIGAPLFAALFALAALGDQMRLQPESVSLTILMVASAAGSSGRAVARWHLASLWIWSGLHKALSLGWTTRGALFIADSLGANGARPAIAIVLPIVEVALGVTALVPRLWRATALGGLALHISMFTMLSPLMRGWNSAVWPWNIALALAAFLLFCTEPRERPAPTPAVRVAAVALLAFPALFYAGLADTYLSHNLYTSNAATARICIQGGLGCASAPFATLATLNVPMPPEPRLYRQWFSLVCRPGTALEITGIQTRLNDPFKTTRQACRRHA